MWGWQWWQPFLLVLICKHTSEVIIYYGATSTTSISALSLRREGEVLDLLVLRRRDKTAVVKLMRKLFKKHGFAPRRAGVTDKLRSYAARSPN
jgi:transposase-like protein